MPAWIPTSVPAASAAAPGFEDFDLGDIFSSFFGGGFGGGGRQRNPNAPSPGKICAPGWCSALRRRPSAARRRSASTGWRAAPTATAPAVPPGTTAEVCPDCHGTGYVQVQRRTMLGVMSSSQPCQRCSGKGKIIHQPCKTCRGAGAVRKAKKITVKIPAGADTGNAFSLRGQGHAGLNGGPAGNLIVVVEVRPIPSSAETAAT